MTYKDTYILCFVCSMVFIVDTNYAEPRSLNSTHTYTQHTLELKPSLINEPSYHIAAAHFLPNYEDHLASFQNSNLNFSNISSQQCTGFALNSCPSHAKCLKCAFDKKYQINSCVPGYKTNPAKSDCVAKPCSEIKTGYAAAVPADKNCAVNIITDITCYSACYNVSCGAYPLTLCPANANCSSCPDCAQNASRAGNCSSAKLKVVSCKYNTQKVNGDATACIDKDDTCIAGYFKACDTGIDGNYEAQYTEMGNACYKCKSRTCASGAWNLDYYFCNGFLKCLLPAK